MSENLPASNEAESNFEGVSTLKILSNVNRRDGFMAGTGVDTAPSDSPTAQTGGDDSPVPGTHQEEVTVPIDPVEEPLGIEDIIKRKQEAPVKKVAPQVKDSPVKDPEPVEEISESEERERKLKEYQEEIAKERKRVADHQRQHHQERARLKKMVQEGKITQDTAEELLNSQLNMEEDENQEAVRMAREVVDAVNLISVRDPSVKVEYNAFIDHYQSVSDSDRADIDIQLLAMRTKEERLQFVTALGRENVDEAYVEVHKSGNQREGIKKLYEDKRSAEQRAFEAEAKLAELQKQTAGLMDGGRKSVVRTSSKPSMAGNNNRVQQDDGSMDTSEILKLSNSPKRYVQK